MSEARRLWPIALVSGLLLGSVWLHVQATLMGYRASEARKTSRSLRAHNAYLRLEADRLRSPSALEHEARRRLGMHRPDPEQMVVLAPAAVPARAARSEGVVQLASALWQRLP